MELRWENRNLSSESRVASTTAAFSKFINEVSDSLQYILATWSSRLVSYHFSSSQTCFKSISASLNSDHRLTSKQVCFLVSMHVPSILIKQILYLNSSFLRYLSRNVRATLSTNLYFFFIEMDSYLVYSRGTWSKYGLWMFSMMRCDGRSSRMGMTCPNAWSMLDMRMQGSQVGSVLNQFMYQCMLKRESVCSSAASMKAFLCWGNSSWRNHRYFYICSFFIVSPLDICFITFYFRLNRRDSCNKFISCSLQLICSMKIEHFRFIKQIYTSSMNLATGFLAFPISYCIHTSSPYCCAAMTLFRIGRFSRNYNTWPSFVFSVAKLRKHLRSIINMKRLALLLKHQIRIDTFKTPNPNFIKFFPIGKLVLGDKGTLDISSKQFSTISPLAEELFAINGVTRVFYAADYLSVAKQENGDWDIIQPEIFRVVSAYYDADKPILVGDAALQPEDINEDDSQVVQFIKEIIAARIRPNVQEDGGDVKFVSYNEQTGRLTLRMEGACAGCPSSSATLKGGIEKMLTYYIKQIKEVVAEDQKSCH